MLDPVQDLTQSIARARRKRGLPPHVVDHAKVQASLDAYLLARGRRVAEGMDLGPVHDRDLAELGYLDAIAQHPGLSPGLAAVLEMVGDQRHPRMAQDQHELDHQRRQHHDHGRLRETGVDLDQEHDRIQILGLDQTAPETGTTDRSRMLEPERADGTGVGHHATAARGVGKRGRKDPIKRYLENVPDPDDEDWTPA
jgi:hypothetical protein